MESSPQQAVKRQIHEGWNQLQVQPQTFGIAVICNWHTRGDMSSVLMRAMVASNEKRTIRLSAYSDKICVNGVRMM